MALSPIKCHSLSSPWLVEFKFLRMIFMAPYNFTKPVSSVSFTTDSLPKVKLPDIHWMLNFFCTLMPSQIHIQFFQELAFGQIQVIVLTLDAPSVHSYVFSSPLPIVWPPGLVNRSNISLSKVILFGVKNAGYLLPHKYQIYKSRSQRSLHMLKPQYKASPKHPISPLGRSKHFW